MTASPWSQAVSGRLKAKVLCNSATIAWCKFNNLLSTNFCCIILNAYMGGGGGTCFNVNELDPSAIRTSWVVAERPVQMTLQNQ